VIFLKRGLGVIHYPFFSLSRLLLLLLLSTCYTEQQQKRSPSSAFGVWADARARAHSTLLHSGTHPQRKALRLRLFFSNVSSPFIFSKTYKKKKNLLWMGHVHKRKRERSCVCVAALKCLLIFFSFLCRFFGLTGIGRRRTLA
jgi:hypothetical protein